MYRPISKCYTQIPIRAVSVTRKPSLLRVAYKHDLAFPSTKTARQFHSSASRRSGSATKVKPGDAAGTTAGTPRVLTPTLQQFTLDGKVALVTGAGRGLGFNIAKGLLEAGARALAILDYRQEEGELAAKQLTEETGTPVTFFHCDITEENSVEEAVQSAVRNFGGIDILVNSAGVAEAPVPAETYPPASFRRVLDINTTGTFLVAQSVGRQMISQRTPGSMILIASMCAHIIVRPQEQAAYNASKSAVVGITRSLASEWAQHGIRVNSISPGYMETKLNLRPEVEMMHDGWREKTPLGRLGRVEELNGVVVWLAGRGSGFVTGADIGVDGGYTVW